MASVRLVVRDILSVICRMARRTKTVAQAGRPVLFVGRGGAL